MSKTIFQLAEAQGRDYITPEDVVASIRSGRSIHLVRVDVLRVIGRQPVKGKWWGAEDQSCCAFCATPERHGRKGGI